MTLLEGQLGLLPLRELGEYDVVPTALEVLQVTSTRRIVSDDVPRG